MINPSNYHTFQTTPPAHRELIASYLSAPDANALGVTCHRNVELMEKSPDYLNKKNVEHVFLKSTQVIRGEIVTDMEIYNREAQSYKRYLIMAVITLVALHVLAIGIYAAPMTVGALLLHGVIAGSAKLGLLLLGPGQCAMVLSALAITGIWMYFCKNGRNPPTTYHIQTGLNNLNVLTISQKSQFNKTHSSQIPVLENQNLLRMIRSWEAEKAAKKQAVPVIVDQIHADQVD